MTFPSKECKIKVVLLGATGVGKTSIVSAATTGQFSDGTLPTLGASFATKTMEIDRTTVLLQIWDTAGQEKYRAMAPMYFHNAQVGIAVYSIADLETFVAVDSWIKTFKDHAHSNAHVFLVGNKVDLEEFRAVTADDATEKAKNYGATFLEVSAKSAIGIDDLFELIPRTFMENAGATVSTADSVAIATGSEASSPCC
jgi:small GTP-binding protein